MLQNVPGVTSRFDTRPEFADVVHVIIDNSRSLNALNSDLMSQFVAVVNALHADQKMRAIVVTGAGEKAFIGGADIHELSQLANPTAARAFITRVHECCRCLRDLPVPVIARVNGYALGAGLELAAACDMRVASSNAVFGMPEVKFGMPSVVEAALLPGLIGWGRTRRLLLLGDTIDAAEALQWGLVEKVVAPEALDAAVDSWLRLMATNGNRGMRLQKRLIRDWETLPIDQAVSTGIATFSETFETGEARQMLRSFIDRPRG
ncbi:MULTISPECIES: enoyl-CoA hydratase [unclassified Bradyrhizobium]|uniref:enoyl-CoA hydratase n=1 Tax=unclassified Bradyrhizobium TaxID=2631580 RepID=UPI00143D2E50|nr:MULTISPECIES: enoyl-CoA hydratase [unclassified Bradyrhizobium]